MNYIRAIHRVPLSKRNRRKPNSGSAKLNRVFIYL
jgi:hypothetical protein